MPSATINGFEHYWEDQGSGEPLVLFHGAIGSSVTMAEQIKELSKTHRVIVPDMRAMGRSAHVKEIPPSAWLDDAVALFKHLGLGRAHVYGVSLGARVALRLAGDHPQLVQSLIQDMPIIAMESHINQVLNADLGGLDDLPAEQKAMRQAQHGDDWQDVVRNYMTIRNRQELQDFYSLRELSRTVKAPTLIFRADDREIHHPIGHCFELHTNIPGSWLWIRANTEGNLLKAAPDEGYALMRRFMAQAR